MNLQPLLARIGLLGAFATLLAALTANPCRAEDIINETVPFTLIQSIDCDRDGVPEDIVLLTGNLHTKVTMTVDARGIVHTTALFQPQGVVGVGLMTYDTYQAVGMTGYIRNDPDNPFVDTFVNNFHLVARGGGMNYNVKSRIHVMIVDGQVDVIVEITEITCN